MSDLVLLWGLESQPLDANTAMIWIWVSYCFLMWVHLIWNLGDFLPILWHHAPLGFIFWSSKKIIFMHVSARIDTDKRKSFFFKEEKKRNCRTWSFSRERCQCKTILMASKKRRPSFLKTALSSCALASFSEMHPLAKRSSSILIFSSSNKNSNGIIALCCTFRRFDLLR